MWSKRERLRRASSTDERSAIGSQERHGVLLSVECPDLPAAFMHPSVVMATEQHTVGQVGPATVEPRDDVMCVGVSRGQGTPGKATATVANREGKLLARCEQPLGATHIKGDRLRTEHDAGDGGVAPETNHSQGSQVGRTTRRIGKPWQTFDWYEYLELGGSTRLRGYVLMGHGGTGQADKTICAPLSGGTLVIAVGGGEERGESRRDDGCRLGRALSPAVRTAMTSDSRARLVRRVVAAAWSDSGMRRTACSMERTCS